MAPAPKRGGVGSEVGCGVLPSSLTLDFHLWRTVAPTLSLGRLSTSRPPDSLTSL